MVSVEPGQSPGPGVAQATPCSAAEPRFYGNHAFPALARKYPRVFLSLRLGIKKELARRILPVEQLLLFVPHDLCWGSASFCEPVFPVLFLVQLIILHFAHPFFQILEICFNIIG